MRILIVEDDPTIARVQQGALEREGFQVSVSGTGRDAVRVTQVWNPDLVLLDHILPDVEGREVVREIRGFSRVPIIMVTARVEEKDRIASLEAGADDYVGKPFSMPELVARVRAVLRRVKEPIERAGPLTVKDLTLDEESRHVRRNGDAINLTKIEFDLLRVLMQQPGIVVSRHDVARVVWNATAAQIGKALDVHMSSLRRKLDDNATNPRYIETVRGVGFRLSP